MKKAELKAIAERYGMGILREEITDKAIGLYLETEEDIPRAGRAAESAVPARSSGRHKAGGRRHQPVPCILPHKLA